MPADAQVNTAGGCETVPRRRASMWRASPNGCLWHTRDGKIEILRGCNIRVAANQLRAQLQRLNPSMSKRASRARPGFAPSSARAQAIATRRLNVDIHAVAAARHELA